MSGVQGNPDQESEGVAGFRNYHEQLFLQQQQQQIYETPVGVGSTSVLLPEISPSQTWNSLPVPLHVLNPYSLCSNPFREHEPYVSNLPPVCEGLLDRAASSLQFTYDPHCSDRLGLAHLYGSDRAGLFSRPGSSSLGLHSDHGKPTAQEIMDAKALAASKSHSEAERRRRERINSHLAKLRSLLPNTAKTDKASLLAEVIQHVKELKQQTSEIAEAGPVPTEADELVVDAADEGGRFMVRASLCCQDRSDLLPDLIKTLKDLRLRTLKAEITTLGGRVRNVLLITGEEDTCDNERPSIHSIHEALRAVMEKTMCDDSSSSSLKRQRTNAGLLEHRAS